jgi:hypothetical protein
MAADIYKALYAKGYFLQMGKHHLYEDDIFFVLKGNELRIVLKLMVNS